MVLKNCMRIQPLSLSLLYDLKALVENSLLDVKKRTKLHLKEICFSSFLAANFEQGLVIFIT